MGDQRHKRDTNARRKPKAALVAGPLAVLATAAVVTLGVVVAQPETRNLAANADTGALTDLTATRDALVSRSESRREARRDVVGKAKRPVPGKRLERAYAVDLSPGAVRAAVSGADTRLWTTTLLNVWTTPGDDARQVGVLKSTKRVLVTGRSAAGRDEVVVDGVARWVTSGYFSADKPVAAPTAAAGLSSTSCPDSGPESGLTSSAVLVYRSVCHAFPQITTYGGYDAHGEHASGRAIDIMNSDVALGNAIAAFLQSHAAELHLYDIIWRQHIWTPERASEGWRYMPSRGSATADHYDHVHVSTY